MDSYGGKFQKRREETRERVLQEKVMFIRTFFITVSLSVLISTMGYLGYKYVSTQSWNQDVLMKSRAAWKAMDTLEIDLLNAVLFLKGCRKDMVFQENDSGFELRTVANRTQSMEVLTNVPLYSELAIPVYLGPGIRPGDSITQCTADEEKNLVFRISRKNAKTNFDYLFFTEPATFSSEKPTNLIKFTPITYRWEKQSDRTEKLFRKLDGEEVEIMSGVQSHSIDYAFKGDDDSYFKLKVVLEEKFPNGKNIEMERNIPLVSFERLPAELSDKTL